MSPCAASPNTASSAVSSFPQPQKPAIFRGKLLLLRMPRGSSFSQGGFPIIQKTMREFADTFGRSRGARAMSRNLKRCIFGLILIAIVATVIIGGRFAVHTLAAPQAVIVELQSDPVVVAKAKAEAGKQNFDPIAYRQQILTEQNNFLNQLSAAGIQFSTVGVNAPNGPNGEVTNIQFRYNYVFNGITLAVDPAAVDTIRSMSAVKSVHNDEPITMFLDHAVDYVRAPSLYGNPPQVHMGDSLNSGGVEGQGIYI